jgi:hypothetical protein
MILNFIKKLDKFVETGLGPGDPQNVPRANFFSQAMVRMPGPDHDG